MSSSDGLRFQRDFLERMQHLSSTATIGGILPAIQHIYPTRRLLSCPATAVNIPLSPSIFEYAFYSSMQLLLA